MMMLIPMVIAVMIDMMLAMLAEQSWRARLSTGASREAPVENIRFWLQSWQARLSTGASREAPVENARF